MLSYHSDSKLKKSIVNEMKNHQKHDQFIKGSYGKMNGKFRGCAVGCAIDSFNIKLGKAYSNSDHKAFEDAIGVPECLARVQDCIFEGLPEKDSSKFAVDFLSVIPVGVNLEPVKWKFCVFILKENIERVLTLKIDDELKEKVVDAIRDCLTIHENSIKTGTWDESAARRAAWRAARSVARSVESAAESAESAAESAESAARSAESAARSAESAAMSAESAARSAESAAYQRYAQALLTILKETK